MLLLYTVLAVGFVMFCVYNVFGFFLLSFYIDCSNQDLQFRCVVFVLRCELYFSPVDCAFLEYVRKLKSWLLGFRHPRGCTG